MSFLASLGKFIAPIFSPAGFGNWESAVALIAGIMAKEVVVSTLGVVYGDLNSVLPSHYTALSAYAFLIFVLLYTPCVSVIGTLKKEYSGKFALFSVFYQFVVAWIASVIVYSIGAIIF